MSGPSGDSPAVTVIVVNFNAGPHLARCLDALCRQTFADFEAIVIDNRSTDDSLARARAAVDDPRIRFVELDRNTGFAAANNRGAAEARGAWLALLNPDAFAEPDWIEALLAASRRHPDAGMFGSTQLDAADPAWLDGAGDAYLALGLPWRGGFGATRESAPPEGGTFSVCAAAALYERRGYLALGGLDERFFCYGEDVDLGFRWRLAGGRAVQVTGARVHHIGGASTGGAGSDFALYHGIRNMSWIFVKNMPAALFWPLLPGHVAVLVVLLLRAWRRGDGRVVWRAVRDAATGLPETWRQRRRIQEARRASTMGIARAMCWSPRRYLRRAPVPLDERIRG